MEKIHERIKLHRLLRGLKQNDLAKMIGVSVATYSRIESGERKLSMSHFAKISKALELSNSTLLEKESDLLEEQQSNYISGKNKGKSLEELIKDNNAVIKKLMILLDKQQAINQQLLKEIRKKK